METKEYYVGRMPDCQRDGPSELNYCVPDLLEKPLLGMCFGGHTDPQLYGLLGLETQIRTCKRCEAHEKAGVLLSKTQTHTGTLSSSTRSTSIAGTTSGVRLAADGRVCAASPWFHRGAE